MAKRSKEEWKIYNNVFDKFTLELLFKMSSQGHFDELESPIAIGKEANVFSASHKQGHKVIVKIYRLENCNFNKMYDYIRTDPRFVNIKKTRRNIIFSWVQREYRNLLKSREVIDVPTPISQKYNVIVMELVGENDVVAPQLKNSVLENDMEMFEKIREMMRNLYHHGFVHADLSEFNILVHQNRPIFIDFSQTTPANDPNAKEYLIRDCKNICNFFNKKGLNLNQDELYEYIIA
jgi:RIO kinase 1